VFNPSNFPTVLPALTYSQTFNRGGVANGDSVEPHNFFQPGPSPKEYHSYTPILPNTQASAIVLGLLVPVELTNVQAPNFWHYDSSTTNRHNLDSFDLWAEFSIGSKSGQPIVITNGNW